MLGKEQENGVDVWLGVGDGYKWEKLTDLKMTSIPTVPFIVPGFPNKSLPGQCCLYAVLLCMLNPKTGKGDTPGGCMCSLSLYLL